MEENLLPQSNDKYRKLQIVLDGVVIILFIFAAVYVYINWDWIKLLTADICQSCMIKTKAFCFYNQTINPELLGQQLRIPN
jgi:hypothetical protein